MEKYLVTDDERKGLKEWAVIPETLVRPDGTKVWISPESKIDMLVWNGGITHEDAEECRAILFERWKNRGIL